ncbi:hypothetical protein HMN09_00018400 [Mycena chlorophos]|uniref:Uncharacterized protein n=1 Tax=Mycena chlorophos TaxID=658473 RepID=A0A8H6WS03_MYCCL|nr:hypothetical protein HMN09_00018400 [Mycena chlorophos]
MAEWHSFAKLRMHTDPTLEHFRILTPEVHRLVRDFKRTTCAAFETYELARETSSRNRKAVADAAKSGATAKAVSKKRKTLNLNTYKYHSMPDFPPTIPKFSTTDLFSTRLGESLHRLIKRLYSITSKRDHPAQIAKRYIRIQRARMSAAVDGYKARRAGARKRAGSRPMQRLELVFADPYGAKALEIHHNITLIRRRPLNLHTDFNPRSGDPAMKYFIPHLQDHFLDRLLACENDERVYSDADRRTIDIRGDKIYASKLFRVNYTTYDVRRDQDVMNSGALPFIMVHSPDAGNPGQAPYLYAQLLGIFNATVSRVMETTRTTAQRIDFLWVRWMEPEPRYTSGLKEGKLPLVRYVADTDATAFGFLDPELVVRGAHLMPVFSRGRTAELLATETRTAARFANDCSDWKNYYVGIFVDRDMAMRYIGGGIGHLDTGHGELRVAEGLESDVEEDEDPPGPADTDDDTDEGNTSSSSSESDSDAEDEVGGGGLFNDDDEMDID